MPDDRDNFWEMAGVALLAFAILAGFALLAWVSP